MYVKVYFSRVHFSGLCLKKPNGKKLISLNNQFFQVRSEFVCLYVVAQAQN